MQFWTPTNRLKCELVYSSETDISEMTEIAFDATASYASVLLKAANILSSTVTAAYNNALCQFCFGPVICKRFLRQLFSQIL